MSDQNKRTLYDANAISGATTMAGRLRSSASHMLNGVNYTGLFQTAQEIFQNMFDESVVAYHDGVKEFHCKVEFHKNGAFTMFDSGRGIPVEVDDVFGQSALYNAAEEFAVGGKNEKLVKGRSAYNMETIGAHGVGLSVVNACGRVCDIDVFLYHQGEHYSVKYRKGERVQDLLHHGPSPIVDGKKIHGTRIHYLYDDEIFKLEHPTLGTMSYPYIYKDILDMFVNYLYTSKNMILEFIWDDGEKQDHRVLNAKDFDHIESLTQAADGEVFNFICFDTELEYKLDVTLALTSNIRNNIYTCNYITLHQGSLHNAVKNSIQTITNEVYTKWQHDAMQKYKPEVVSQVKCPEISNRISIVASLLLKSPYYGDQAKTKLAVDDIQRHMTASLIVEYQKSAFYQKLTEYIAGELYNALTAVMQKIADAERAAKQKQKAAAIQQGKGKIMSSTAILRPKVANPRQCVLIILEGTSSLDAVRAVRNPDNTCVVAVESTPPNAFKFTEEQMSHSQKFKVVYPELIKDYSACVIMMDSDAPGLKIVLYYLALMFQYAPEYIEKNKVYVLKAPKFMYQYKGSKGEVVEDYAFNDAEFEAARAQFGPFLYQAEYKGTGSVPQPILKRCMQEERYWTKIDCSDVYAVARAKGLLESFMTSADLNKFLLLKTYGTARVGRYFAVRPDIMKKEVMPKNTLRGYITTKCEYSDEGVTPSEVFLRELIDS